MEHPIPCVRVILENENGEILFLKRDNTNYGSDKWILPGGKIKLGESAEDACISEVKEETNLEIDDLEFLFYSDDFPKDENELHCLTLYFIAEFSGDVKINEESSEFKWVKIEEIDNLEIAFSQKEIIKNYFDSLNNGS
ncbi:MAG: NUDIX hydrolase [Nanoarchaeota archaeon]